MRVSVGRPAAPRPTLGQPAQPTPVVVVVIVMVIVDVVVVAHFVVIKRLVLLYEPQVPLEFDEFQDDEYFGDQREAGEDTGADQMVEHVEELALDEVEDEEDDVRGYLGEPLFLLLPLLFLVAPRSCTQITKFILLILRGPPARIARHRGGRTYDSILLGLTMK